MIQTLQQQISKLEVSCTAHPHLTSQEENQRLNGQLTDLLEEETQRDLDAYATTPAGAELRFIA